MKKLLSLLTLAAILMTVLAVLPFASHAAPAVIGEVADGYTPAEGSVAISSVAEFEAMQKDTNYHLTQDLDFSGKTYDGKVVPVADFNGTLDGCGYALKGITITSGGDAGIFDLWFKGTLKNISLGVEGAPVSITGTNGGASVGVVSGTSGDCTFDNVSIYANVDAQGKTAGFMAYMSDATITINNCEVRGSIKGGATAGFVVTTSGHPHTMNLTITNSVNYADISSYTIAPCGGFYTRDVDSGELRTTNVTITGCANYGNITANDWRVGGIVGEYSGKAESTLLVDHCYNAGDITMINDGGFAAGIVGGIGNNNDPTGARVISNCYNIGKITHQVRPTERAYDITYYDRQGGTYTVKNCIGPMENKSNLSDSFHHETNLATATDASEILSFLAAYEPENAEVTFVADSENINGGYPVLSWQVVEEPEDTTPDTETEAPDTEPEAPEETPAFSEGTIEKTDDGKYTIASDGFSAFISTRRNATNAAHNDIRIILATDIEGLDAYAGLNLILTFKKDGEVVKTGSWDVVEDLDIYASAIAAGNTYTAADGCALFGIVITSVPNADWDEIIATVTDDTGKGIGEGSAEADGLVVPAPVDIKGELGSLIIEDQHASLDKWPSLVFSMGNTTLWQTLRGDKENYPDNDHWSNPAYKWVLIVNGEEIVPEKFSIYDGGAWGYFRAAIAPKDALDYVDNTATLDITLNIYDNATGYLVYFADLDPLTYERPIVPVHDPIHIDSAEGVTAALWGTPFETPGGLGGKAALIYRVTGIFETINGYISDEVAYAKVTLNGTVYTIKNYENGGDIFRFDVQSEGAVIYSGLTYTVKVEIYNTNDQLLYYSNEYTCVSTLTSSNAAERSAMNVTLPDSLTKLTVDTSKLSTENINHWGDGPVANLFDGKTGVGGSAGSKMGGNKGAGDPTVYFSLSEAATVSYFTFTTGGDTGSYKDRNPYGFTLYGKVDGEWVILADIRDNETNVTGFTPANSTPYSYATSNPQACIEYKVVLYTGGGFQLNELELYAG